MTRRKIRTTEQVIRTARLRQFADFTEQHRVWQQQLRACLQKLGSEHLQQHAEVLAIREQTLHLHTTSAAVATRLKQLQSGIITYFAREAMLPVQQLSVRTAPKTPAVTTSQSAAAPTAAQPSAKTAPPDEHHAAAQLRAQAALVDEPLRSQLLALAAKFEQ